MNVLITGGAGFIGAHLAEALVGRARARVLDNFSNSAPARLARVAPAAEVIRGDVRDPAALAAAAAGAEVIFHLAALVSVVQSLAQPVETFDVNLTGTLRVLEAARHAGARRVVLASTCAVYGDSARLPLAEGDPAAPRSPYAASKLAAEQALALYARLYGLETVALRFFNVYGPRQDPASPYAAVVPRFIADLRAGRRPTIYGDGRQTRDFVYVDDVVEGLWAAATLPGLAGRAFNLGRGEETSVLDLATALAGLLGVAGEPSFAPPREGEVRRSRADVTAFAGAGFRAPTGLREGLARTLAAHDM